MEPEPVGTSEAAFRRAVIGDVPALLELQSAYYTEDAYPFNERQARGAWEALLADATLGTAWEVETDKEAAQVLYRTGLRGPPTRPDDEADRLEVTFRLFGVFGRARFVRSLYSPGSHDGSAAGGSVLAGSPPVPRGRIGRAVTPP